MSALNESVREQLRKIAALAEGGVGGERENARALLARLCERHGVSPETLLDETPTEIVELAFKGDLEKGLLMQVLIFVCQRRDVRWGALRRGHVSALLSKAEAIDAVACWQHYRKLWCAEVKLFRSAFIHKHDLFGPPSDKPVSITSESLARSRRLVEMMRGVGGTTWQRPVALLEGVKP